MKIANTDGRAALVLADGIADVASASGGRFGPDPMAVYEAWDDFVAFAGTVTTPTAPFTESSLRNPVPLPRQVFGIGLNYRQHAAESGRSSMDVPATFTKFPASLAGPFDDIEEAVVSMLKAKQAGQTFTVPEPAAPANVVNIMDALKKSLEVAGGDQLRRHRAPSKKTEAPAAKEAARKPVAKKPAARKAARG